jgi:hypothetical protein
MLNVDIDYFYLNFFFLPFDYCSCCCYNYLIFIGFEIDCLAPKRTVTKEDKMLTSCKKILAYLLQISATTTRFKKKYSGFQNLVFWGPRSFQFVIVFT